MVVVVVVLLFLLFVVMPILELAVIVQVSSVIGVLPTIAILLGMALLGSWLVKYEGLGIYRRLQTTLARGELPARELVDGVLVLFAGALLLTPGFLTDALGLVLLLPPTRAGVRVLLLRRFRRRLEEGLGFMMPGMAAAGRTGAGGASWSRRVYTGTAVYDVDVVDADEPRSGSRQPGRGGEVIELGPGS